MSSNWKPHLQRLAREHKMCAENRAYLNACETKEDAIRIYKQTIDWALGGGLPDLDFLRKEFNGPRMVSLLTNTSRGNHYPSTKICLSYRHYSCRVLTLRRRLFPMCYFANNCDMTIGHESPIECHISLVKNIVAENTATTELVYHDIKKGGER